MGPHKEHQKIEQLHRRTLELDIESVSQDAQPSYHDNYRAPRGLAVLQSIEANGGRVVVNNVDYQITKIELKPIGIKSVEKPVQKKGSQHSHSHSQEALDYKAQMKSIKERRVRRKVAPTFLEGGIRNEDYHGAFHNYVSESTEYEYDPITMTPKLQDSGSRSSPSMASTTF